MATIICRAARREDRSAWNTLIEQHPQPDELRAKLKEAIEKKQMGGGDFYDEKARKAYYWVYSWKAARLFIVTDIDRESAAAIKQTFKPAVEGSMEQGIKWNDKTFVKLCEAVLGPIDALH